MERINETLAFVGVSPVDICMFVAQVLPCNIVIQQFSPVSRYLRGSCEGLRVIDERKYLERDDITSASLSLSLSLSLSSTIALLLNTTHLETP